MDAIDFPILINAIYLLAAVLIFLGLKRLGSPATAREGNRIAALGMLIAVVVTLLDREIVRFEIIVAGDHRRRGHRWGIRPRDSHDGHAAACGALQRLRRSGIGGGRGGGVPSAIGQRR